MAFVLRTRENGQFAADAFSSRAAALKAYEAAWRRMREAKNEWAVALYEVPRTEDTEAAIAIVLSGKGLIILHRDNRTDDAATRELGKILGGKP